MTPPPDVSLLDVSLLDGPVPWLLVAAGVAGAAHLLAGPRGRWWTRTVPAVLAAAVVLTAVLALVVDRVWHPFADPLPAVVLAAGCAALAAVGLAVAGARRRRWRGRLTTVVALVAVLAAAAQAVNAAYGEYPTLRTALGVPAPDQVALGDVPGPGPLVDVPAGTPLLSVWRPPAALPTTGVVTQVQIPPTVSGFAARPALVYLPPAYLSSPRAVLPVLVLLAGQPGSPSDWFDGGQLAQRMDAFAAAHAGLAPVVVVPDQLGDPLANPMCLDSRLGRVATYLSVDVPAWVRSALQVDPDPRAWAVGGLSNGGTCALQMAVNAPEVYPTFVDLSGEAEPTLGDRATSVQAAFGGDDAAFAAVAPLDVLRVRTFPGTAGYLVAGRDDPTYLPAAQQVLAACRAAGMDVQLQVLPGGHSWQVWGPGLGSALPWLGDRLGLTDRG